MIVCYPTKISVPNNIEVYPGKNIKLNFGVFDCNNTDSTCVADVFRGCGDKLFCTYSSNSTKIQLADPVTVILSSGIIDTGLVAQSTYDMIHQNSRNESTKLYFQCRDPPTGMNGVMANITKKFNRLSSWSSIIMTTLPNSVDVLLILVTHSSVWLNRDKFVLGMDTGIHRTWINQL